MEPQTQEQMQMEIDQAARCLETQQETRTPKENKTLKEELRPTWTRACEAWARFGLTKSGVDRRDTRKLHAARGIQGRVEAALNLARTDI